MTKNIKDPSLKKPTPAEQGVVVSNSPLLNFFVEALKDIYWAEKELLKVLPKMKEAATTEELKQAIAKHFSETKGHVKRIENVFAVVGHPAEAKVCHCDGGTCEGR